MDLKKALEAIQSATVVKSDKAPTPKRKYKKKEGHYDAPLVEKFGAAGPARQVEFSPYAGEVEVVVNIRLEEVLTFDHDPTIEEIREALTNELIKTALEPSGRKIGSSYSKAGAITVKHGVGVRYHRKG